MASNTGSYSAEQGRRFALTLAAALAVFAFIGWWSGRGLLPFILIAIASILNAAGLIAPTRLQPLERAWMALAHAISRVTTPILMGIVYFLVLSPVGVVRRFAGRNPLDRQPVNGSYWIARQESDPAVRRKRMERQF